MTTTDAHSEGSTPLAGSLTDGWLARDQAALSGVLPRYYPVVAERGEGSWLIDVEGRRFLDFGSGIGVTNIGHCHPRVVAAIQRQAATLVHTSVVVHHQRNIELAERLAALTPFLDRPQAFFCNSGAEAVDGAIKLARRVTGRPGVVAFERAFHGRTMGATSLTTAKAKYREGYEPLLPGVHHAPYCIPRHTSVPAALDGLDRVMDSPAAASGIGMMIVEPVLGEGGYVVPPIEWLAGLRDRCTARGILLAFDEVQSGVGRTGRPFAAETFGVSPDILLFAKGIASGLPLGGLLASRSVMDQWPTGTHGSTFGGNPVACAAALATLDVLDEEHLYDRARLLGARSLARLRAVQSRCPDLVLDVRGVGMMIGIELPDRDAASRVAQSCLRRGLLVLTCGPADNVLRLAPPLNLSDGELELGLAVLEDALTSTAA